MVRILADQLFVASVHANTVIDRRDPFYSSIANGIHVGCFYLLRLAEWFKTARDGANKSVHTAPTRRDAT
jgi:hypothetical protein